MAAGATRGHSSHKAPTGGLQKTRGPRAAVKYYYQPWAPRPDVYGHRVGPGTLDQELQEPKGLHQNQITSKKPPDSKGNQEAEMAAAKGLLPHEDHRRTKS